MSYSRLLTLAVIPSMALLAVTAVYRPHSADAQAHTDELTAAQHAFVRVNCVGCHGKGTPAARLDLSAVQLRTADQQSCNLWVKILDRVSAGEMPPKGFVTVSAVSRAQFLAGVKSTLMASYEAQVHRYGRSTWRRMNRFEYENTVRDLLDAPWLQISPMLPEDGLAYRLNKSGEALDVSHVQMSRYLAAADYSLREVMPKGPNRPPTQIRRFYSREQGSFVGAAKFSEFNGAAERATFPILADKADLPALMEKAPMTVGASDPVKRELEAMGVVASAYEPLQPHFDQFRAPYAGHYKLRLRSHSFWSLPQNEKRWWQPSRTELSAGRTHEPVSLYALLPPQQLRKLGDVDSSPESTTSELDVYLLKNETIMPDAARFFRSRPPGWHNPLAQKDGQPGVAFQWLEVEGPIYAQWPTPAQKLLFGSLPLKQVGRGTVEAVSSDPDADATKLITTFMQRAIRRTVAASEIQPFVKLFHTAREAGAGFTDSLVAAYTGVLCSPAFVTLEERAGPLEDHALAARLSYFLWNSEPDSRLRLLADSHKLHDSAVLSAEADRLLADPKSRRFVDAFLDYWLDLRKTDNTSPDEVLYPDYYLDDYLVQSSVEETRAFFAELVKANLPARNIVSSSFAMLNDRMAAQYGIAGVEGSQFRKVVIPDDSVRGGLLTQASVLKVTANGTTTSPVLRGVWINERILGLPVPPPPPSVPAVEPDIRGASTIREQLSKHRTQPTCRACHAKIDPAGFALESFDVFGGYRDHYRALGDGVHTAEFGKNGQPFTFHPAQPVDASGDLPDGRHFSDVRDLKRLVLQDERQIARNLVRQLIVYSTGTPVQYGDRQKVEAILSRESSGRYGIRSLIHGIIESELFRNK